MRLNTRKHRFEMLVVMPLVAVIVLVMSSAASTAFAVATESPSSGACSSAQLAERSWALESRIDQSRAVSLASSSPAFQSLKDTLGHGDVLAFESTFELWHVDEAACAPILQSVNVVYGASSYRASPLIVVSEDPSLTMVESITVQPGGGPQEASSGQSGSWSGYEVQSSGTVDGQWVVPTGSTASNCQNANGCDILWWVGQTASSNGITGISQTGTEEWVWYNSWSQTWNVWYYLWYEFYPYNGVTECGNGNVHAGDDVSAISNYLNGQYYISVVDSTQSLQCTSHQSMSMGAPNYAEWIGEDGWYSPCSCNRPTPPFSTMTFTEMRVGGNGNIPGMNPSKWTSATQVSVGPVSYVLKARPPFSWFPESYT